jgi:hypothetical protein
VRSIQLQQEENVVETTRVKFKLVDKTKGALRYVEIDDEGNERKTDADGAIIGTLYLRKAAQKGKLPEEWSADLYL